MSRDAHGSRVWHFIVTESQTPKGLNQMPIKLHLASRMSLHGASLWLSG